LVEVPDGDEVVASNYVPPAFPLWTIGSEMSFQEVKDDICAKWVVIDDLCTLHLSSLWRRLVILKTVRDLWAYSAEAPLNNSAEALSRFDENTMRKKLLDKIDDSMLQVPVRVLDMVVQQFMRLSDHWNQLRAPNDVLLIFHARSWEMKQICKLFF